MSGTRVTFDSTSLFFGRTADHRYAVFAEESVPATTRATIFLAAAAHLPLVDQCQYKLHDFSKGLYHRHVALDAGRAQSQRLSCSQHGCRWEREEAESRLGLDVTKKS